MENEFLKQAIVKDPLVWADTMKINLRDGIVFSLKDMSYLFDIIDCDKKTVNCKKGAQMCLTTAFFISSVHACKYRRYNQNIMYMMPTRRVGKFSPHNVKIIKPRPSSHGHPSLKRCKHSKLYPIIH